LAVQLAAPQQQLTLLSLSWLLQLSQTGYMYNPLQACILSPHARECAHMVYTRAVLLLSCSSNN
jgi:hypothetical protein